MRMMAVVLAGVLVAGMQAQGMRKTVASSSGSTVPVLMLSDIHFDPFHDPAKVEMLRGAKVEDWEGILTSPDSATQGADFERLQRQCRMKGVDTPMPLLLSSLKAERAEMPWPLFVTVSGDLMAHQFDCRFKALTPKASEGEYAAFAAKTTAFVALELHRTFPESPVYLALGNNDSGCRDYSEDADSAYLKSDAMVFAADAMNATNAAAIRREFSQYGDYDVLLPAPMEHTRLIVMQDLFEARKYTDCDGTPSRDSAKAQIAWLQQELTAARAAHDRVWVMAHMPPGIDAYSTLAHGGGCSLGSTTMFLGSDALAETLGDFAGTIKLALFGHTHMDEMKLIQGEGGSVPVKLVPSITPVNGNNPAFTMAMVNPRTATLVDYAVIAANNQTGVGTKWMREYTYSATYKEPDYSAESLGALTAGFLADKPGTTDASHSYQKYFYVGDPGVSANVKAAAMQLLWHGYACSMTAMDDDSYRKCVCGK